MLSRLFSRPMTCVCMPTYGIPFDMIMMMLQRCMVMPSQTRRNLYTQMRCALLDDSMQRCVVMCHNHGAVLVSQAISQLCADLPSEKLRKLEIYTFGSAACEFMMPLGEANMEPESMHPADMTNTSSDRKSVHIEHFAMSCDPFAQMGVLQSVRNHMDGRVCGGVFTLNMSHMPNSKDSTHMHTSCGLTMEDYLMCLFPTKLAMASPSTASASPMRSLLDHKMMIDRDCAEKREIVAMACYSNASHTRKDKSGKRSSWTGLAATMGANGAQKNGVSAGMAGLEMARKGCTNCSGHKGREVSWLVRYVSIGQAMEAKQAAEVAGMGRG